MYNKHYLNNHQIPKNFICDDLMDIEENPIIQNEQNQSTGSGEKSQRKLILFHHHGYVTRDARHEYLIMQILLKSRPKQRSRGRHRIMVNHRYSACVPLNQSILYPVDQCKIINACFIVYLFNTPS